MELALKKQKNRGVTLVELLVDIFIFSLLLATIVTLLVSAVKMQRQSLAQQEVLSQTSYAMEYMSRALRMAQYDSSGGCGGKNYFDLAPTQGIKFLDYSGRCVEFFLDLNSRQLKENKGGVISDLTSGDLRINSFSVFITGDDAGDLFQPKATISLDVVHIRNSQAKIKTQATVSQRNLDL